jgi:NADPH:quinone reductase-like Zn-dependent oxidoreductase
MRAVRYHEAGGPDVLCVEEVDRPDPGPGEVLVEVEAASVNPVDAKFRAAGLPRLPKTTGSDLAGTVAAVGKGVDYAVDDRVFATGLHVGRFAGGSFADYAAVPTDLLAPLPDGVSVEAGAAVALVGVTAWRAFVDHAALEPGETAFVHGGAGGVGHAAVGLADALGATPVATARPEHHGAVEGFGAAAVLDYDREDLVGAAREATGDEHGHTGGADAVLDHMPDRYFGADAEIAAHEGDVVVIAGETATLPEVTAARGKELDLHLMSMSNLAIHPDMPDIGPILSKLGRLLAEDRLTVAIDRTHGLDEAAEAHRAVMEDSVVGKIVVVP